MSLTSFFELFDVLIESFTLFIPNVFTIFSKTIQMTLKNALSYSYQHQAPRSFVLAHQLDVFSCLLFHSQENSESII